MKSRRFRHLAIAGARYVGAAMRGRPPAMGSSPAQFARSVATALRPHFFALPAGASLAGSATAATVDEPWAVAVAAAASGLGWGVGQLLNDLLDVHADAVGAPDRPAPRGLLPEGPTMTVALGLGLVVAAAAASVHPQAYWLAAVAAALLLTYGVAKPIPALGNVAHGMLIATAAAIGRAASSRGLPLTEALSGSAPVCAVTATIAALFLQANYEKDRLGDAAAGYRTLAHVLGVRGSAALRLVGTGAVAATALRLGLLPSTAALVVMGISVVLALASTLPSLTSGTDGAALRGYRLAVHASTTAMLALAAPLLGTPATAAAAAAAVLVTEAAFRRSRNP